MPRHGNKVEADQGRKFGASGEGEGAMEEEEKWVRYPPDTFSSSHDTINATIVWAPRPRPLTRACACDDW